MSSQHFHAKALFLLDFRNLAPEEAVIGAELLSTGAGAGLQPAAVTFPSQGAATSPERGVSMQDVGAVREIRAPLWPQRDLGLFVLQECVSISGRSRGTSLTSESH